MYGRYAVSIERVNKGHLEFIALALSLTLPLH